MPHLASIRVIFFDAVGTLLVADPDVVDVYHLAGWQYGSQLPRATISLRLRSAIAASFSGEALVEDGNACGSPLNDTAAPLLRQPTSESRERHRWQQIVAAVFDDVPDAGGPLFRTLWDHFAQPQHWQLFADVPLVLSALVERGLIVGIASNFDRRLLRIRDGHPPLRLCETCFVSSDVGYSKPDPRFFAAIQGQLALEPEQLLLVGNDWVNDFVGAQAAGWQAVHLNRESKADRPENIHSLSELFN